MLKENVRGVPLIVKYLPKLRSLTIITELPYYQPEDWIEISKLQKLNLLSLRRINSNRADLDGIAMILKNCSSIKETRCSHKSDQDLDVEDIAVIQAAICRVVESCEKNTSGYCFKRMINIGSEVTDCELTWIRCASSPLMRQSNKQ